MYLHILSENTKGGSWDHLPMWMSVPVSVYPPIVLRVVHVTSKVSRY
jgi:hypothetical protein